MNKQTLIFLVIAIGALIYFKMRPKTRIEKIDWLNANVGNIPEYVKMDENDLNTTFEFFRYVKDGLKPPPESVAKMRDVSVKYQSLNSLIK